MSDASPPGWYDDPIDSNRTRYWDGSRWTDHVQDRPTPPPFTPTASAAAGAGSSFESTAWPSSGQEQDSAKSRSGRQNRVLVAVAGGVVVLLLVGGLMAMLGSSDSPDDDLSAERSAAAEESVPDKEAVQKQYAAAVQAACENLKADIAPGATRPPIDLEWDQDFEDVLNVEESEMRSEIRECARPAVEAAREQERAADEAAEAAAAAAEAQRQAEAAAAEQAAIDNAGPADVDTIVKNPDAVKGQVFKVVALITQMDAATGPCVFRAYWDNTVRAYNFEYEGDNAMFITTAAPDATSECPIFNGIDQDDTMTLTVRGQGSFSYDTQIGGNTTVPLFQVLRVDKVVKG